MYDRDHGHSGVGITMFGLFKKKEEEQKRFPYYTVNIDDVKTVAQLRECLKAVMKSLGSEDSIRFHIGKEKIKEFPNLAKIATKVGDNRE